MKFGWDEKKAAENLAKHGIDFNDAREFEFATAIIVTDDRKDYGEVRQVALGMVRDRVHVLVFTDRGNERRVISFRKANKREIETYGED